MLLATLIQTGTYFPPAPGKLLYLWGNNTYGQLGDGTTVSKSSPVLVPTSSWKQVSVNRFYTAAIRSDNLLFAWGRNNYGQLGDGTTVNKSSPVQIGSSQWKSVSVATSNTTAIDNNNNLFIWGAGVSVGDNYFLIPYKIKQPSGSTYIDSSWTMVSVGPSHTAAIRSDGILFTWGFNNNGQLGDGTTVTRTYPTQIGNLSWNMVSAGGLPSNSTEYTLGITSNGLLYSWGYGGNGATADGDFYNPNVIKFQVGTSYIDYSWTALSSRGSNFVLAVRNDGLLFSWGRNQYGQLGDGTTVNKSTPVQIGSSSWIAVSTGSLHALAIRSGGTLFSWGRNNYGQLGDSTTVNKSSPVQIGSSSWTTISAYGTVSTGISNNNLFVWGFNGTGFRLGLGDGTTTNRSSPVQIGDPAISWQTAVAGGYQSATLNSTNLLYTWGRNNRGQLGSGSTVNRSSLVQVGGSSWTALSMGMSHTVGIRSDGILFAWGLNNFGQLGDGTGISRSSPVQIGSSSWIAVRAGSYHTVAIRSGGTLFTWGSNFLSQLGDGNSQGTTVISPVQIGSSSWTAIAAGSTFSAGISDGLLYAWGYNSNGQIAVSGSTQIYNWISTSSGTDMHAAIRSDGYLFAWGLNSYGRLGDGTTINKSSPVQIGSSSWIAVSVGQNFTSAIQSGGTLFTWGRNTFGQLGDGTTVDKSSPVQIGSSSWTSVAAGGSHVVAIRSDGLLFAWGNNNLGRLGDGTTVNKSSPVQIGSSSWTAVSGGRNHTIAIRSGGTLFGWGDGTFGQLGYGSTLRLEPGLLSYPQDTASWTSVASGASHVVAIRSDGLLFAWGNNNYGQLGDGTNITRSVPTQIGNDSWTVIGAGRRISAGINSNGIVYTWGYNTNGELGSGDTTSRNAPGTLASGFNSRSATRLGVGANHMMAYFPTLGDVYGWGVGFNGQLGTGSSGITYRLSTPTLLGLGGGEPQKISLGDRFSLVLISNGTLFGTGLNTYGQMSSGNTTQRNVWASIGTSIVYNDIAAGKGHALGIRSTGQLFAWGRNDFGQLGDGTTINRLSMVSIGASSWSAVGSGIYANTSLAIRSGGTLFSWGLNSWGQLGDGTQISKSSPVQIGSSSWIAVSAGGLNSVAIRSGGTLFTWG